MKSNKGLPAQPSSSLIAARHACEFPGSVESAEHHSEILARSHEAMLSDLFDNAPVGMHCLGPDGIILRVNRTEREMLGYTEEEYLGQPATRFHVDPAMMEQQLKALARGGVLREFEAQLRCKDGSSRDVLIDATPLLRDGKVIYIRVTTRDFSAFKGAWQRMLRYQNNLEELLGERTRECQQFRAELESFSYTVSHDLRAPLRAIEGFSDALLEDCSDQLDSAGREFAERIAAGARRMDRLISDILAYTQISHRVVHVAPVRLEPAVHEALQELRGEIDLCQVDLRIEAPLPAVLASRAFLVKALRHLFSNAVKFVTPGTRPCIRFHAESCGEMVRAWVTDNGIGIAPEFHSRIFGVFERLHGVEQYPGTGIGLAIARRAVERMGGRMGVDSALNAGSQFWMELPEVEESHG
jgi:PAS domain S-box-containing protein